MGGITEQIDYTEHRLKLINPLYASMYLQVVDSLSQLDLDEDVKRFILTEHEYDVLQALEWLLDSHFEAFRRYELQPIKISDPDLRIQENTLINFTDLLSEYELVLRWTLLLHDLAKGRENNTIDAHPIRGADIVTAIQSKLWGATTEASELIVWLIRYHDVMGNIYTGERIPEYLLDIGGHLKQTVPDIALRLLQIVTLCDVRGTAKGRFLTDDKAKYWLQLSSKSKVAKLNSGVFEWRIRRWTGNLLGVDDNEQAEIFYSLFDNESQESLFREIFGANLYLIVYGFYLLTELSTENLFKMMLLISEIANNKSVSEFSLVFETIYRPGFDQILRKYEEHISDSRLELHFNKSRNAVIAHIE